MASRKAIPESPAWRPRSKLTSEVQLHLCGSHFTLDKELLANKSAKVSNLLEKNPHGDLSLALCDIPADQETMELVGRFCHGFEINLSTENIVRVACVAHYLEMTDSHCPNNLQSMAFLFFEHYVLPSWNNSIKALKSAECVLQHAVKLGLVNYCMESIIAMVLDEPHLLGEPLMESTSDEDTDDNDQSEETEKGYRADAGRKLLYVHWKSEEVTMLSLRIYVPLMRAMTLRNVPQEYIAANLCQYGEKWIFSNERMGDDMSIYKRNSYREIVEALVKLLPNQRGIIPCSFLFELLQSAIVLDVHTECRNELEIRIGNQLDQASVSDLLILSRGYAKDEQFDAELVRRILKHFYCNYIRTEMCGLNAVADLIDEFLAEISADIDLKMTTFLEFGNMSVAASTGTARTSDGIYRAIDIYLDKHRHMTESEREELCKVLECNKLSVEACGHAAQNERLPVRMVVQVLFVAQLKLREVIPKDVERCDKVEKEGEDGARNSSSEEDAKAEIEKMRNKVLELERECHAMKREMQREQHGVRVRRRKANLWKEMKRRLGCKSKTTAIQDSNRHEKKVVVQPR